MSKRRSQRKTTVSAIRCRFSFLRGSGLPYIEPLAMWNAILGDLILGTSQPIIAARFRARRSPGPLSQWQSSWRGETMKTRSRVSARWRCRVAAFKSRILLEQTVRRLEEKKFESSYACQGAPPTTAEWSRPSKPSPPRISSMRNEHGARENIMCLGIPGRIVRIDDPTRKLATVEVSGVRRQINIACVIDDAHPVEIRVGDWVLVHVGFAMSRIGEEQAAETLKILRQNSGRHKPRSRRCARPQCPNQGGPDMSNEGVLRGLYPFLHRTAQNPEKLSAALPPLGGGEGARLREKPTRRFFGDRA